jgi:hypothetical protein
MKPMSLGFVEKAISDGFSRAKCIKIHEGMSCDLMALNCFKNMWKGSYKTYAAAYIIQLLLRSKEIIKKYSYNYLSPMSISKILFSFLKSTAFTAGDMMILRRLLCIMNKYYKNYSSFCIIIQQI